MNPPSINVVGKAEAFLDRLRMRAVYRRLFNTPDGQTVLNHIGKFCGVAQMSKMDEFMQGRLSVWKQIIKTIKADDANLIHATSEFFKQNEENK